MGNPYFESSRQGPDGPINDDPSNPNDPGPARTDTQEERKACRDSGGTWVNTGGGSGYCQAAPPTNPSGCPEGQERSPFTANGDDAPEPLECVSTAEAQRRFDLRKSRNQNTPSSTSSSTSSNYKPPSNTATKSPYDAQLSQSIFDMIQGIMNGKDVPFGEATIARLMAAALSSNKAQLANTLRGDERRLVAAGLTRTGAAPAVEGRSRDAAAADLSNNLRTVAVTAVQQNYNARVAALKEAQNFLASERANSLSQDQMVLAYARLKQEWATTQSTFAQQWKLAQNADEQAIIQLLLQLKGGI